MYTTSTTPQDARKRSISQTGPTGATTHNKRSRPSARESASPSTVSGTEERVEEQDEGQRASGALNTPFAGTAEDKEAPEKVDDMTPREVEMAGRIRELEKREAEGAARICVLEKELEAKQAELKVCSLSQHVVL